jgi:hypothetical protein
LQTDAYEKNLEILRDGLLSRSEGLQSGQILCITWGDLLGLNVMKAALKVTDTDRDMYTDLEVDMSIFFMPSGGSVGAGSGNSIGVGGGSGGGVSGSGGGSGSGSGSGGVSGSGGGSGNGVGGSGI